MWCKCTIKENLQADWIADHPHARLTSENVEKLVFVANKVWFFEVYEKECGKLVKTVTRLEKYCKRNIRVSYITQYLNNTDPLR